MEPNCLSTLRSNFKQQTKRMQPLCWWILSKARLTCLALLQIKHQTLLKVLPSDGTLQIGDPDGNQANCHLSLEGDYGVVAGLKPLYDIANVQPEDAISLRMGGGMIMVSLVRRACPIIDNCTS